MMQIYFQRINNIEGNRIWYDSPDDNQISQWLYVDTVSA